MGALTPSGIWVPAPTDPVEFHIAAGIIAASASDAIGGLGSAKRQPRLFGVATQAEKIGMEDYTTLPFLAGDRVFVAENAWWETFTAAGWVVTESTVATAFTPAWDTTLFTPGNGVNTFFYWVRDTQIIVQGNFRFGSTSSFPTAGSVPFPLPFPALAGSVSGGVGVCSASDANSSNWYGTVIAKDYSTNGFKRVVAYLYFNAASSYQGIRSPMTKNTPFDWTVSGSNPRQFSVLFTYTRG